MCSGGAAREESHSFNDEGLSQPLDATQIENRVSQGVEGHAQTVHKVVHIVGRMVKPEEVVN